MPLADTLLQLAADLCLMQWPDKIMVMQAGPSKRNSVFLHKKRCFYVRWATASSLATSL
jgi:hypothetical protein